MKLPILDAILSLAVVLALFLLVGMADWVVNGLN